MITSPDATFSGQLMALLTDRNVDNTPFGIEQAEKFKAQLLSENFETISYQALEKQAQDSLIKQQQLEQQDTLTIDQFLADYFSK